MKAIFVALYIMNFDGGEPVLVQRFDTMKECLSSIDGADGSRTALGAVIARFVCVPINIEAN